MHRSRPMARRLPRDEHVVNAPLRGVRRHLGCLRQPYHRFKGQFKALSIIQAPRRRWENRDVQQARPDSRL